MATSLQQLQGVGPKKIRQLHDLGITSLRDLIYYFPKNYSNRSNRALLANVHEDELVTVTAEVVEISERKTFRGKKQVTALVKDETSFLTCVWFNRPFLTKKIHKGVWLSLAGQVQRYRSRWQMVHPEFEIIAEAGEELLQTGKIVPIYRLGDTFSQPFFRRLIRQALELMLPQLREHLPESLLQRQRLMPFRQAVEQIHYPETEALLEAAQKRFIFEEFFLFQLLLLSHKEQTIAQPGIPLTNQKRLTTALKQQLSFALTSGQKQSLREIFADMTSGHAMRRLLQGDVGSGKTIVAIFSMLLAIENGYQAAMMVPTEILAVQHYQNIQNLLAQLDVNVALLKGGTGSEKRQVLADIANGTANMIIGTHAIFQKNVHYQRLGLVIIDEQHRFGVEQREQLLTKSENPHYLVMTATPIPRSLALTLYGDMDVSLIPQLPSGRKPIQTKIIPSHSKKKLYSVLETEMAQGHQAYYICPLIEESEKLPLTYAEEAFAKLCSHFDEKRVGLVHGRMSDIEKQTALERFERGDILILVSTTVVEVGVNVPQATTIVIEHAERFGLAQLHQLRGRVGRSDLQSYCYLICYPSVTETGKQRLQKMVATTDGFELAETDLALRGPGEFFGDKQSGMPEFRIAHLVRDSAVLQQARKEVERLLTEDPHLSTYPLLQQYLERKAIFQDEKFRIL